MRFLLLSLLGGGAIGYWLGMMTERWRQRQGEHVVTTVMTDDWLAQHREHQR